MNTFKSISILSTVGLALVAGGQGRPDDNRTQAALYSLFQQAQSRGDLLGAKTILEKQIIPSLPGNNGTQDRLARLLFELGSYDEAAKHYDLFLKNFPTKNQTPAALAHVQCFGILVNAAAMGFAPDWSVLPNNEGVPNRTAVLNVQAILDGQCQNAIASYYFQTARFLLSELKKVGQPSWVNEALQKQLDKQILAQKRILRP